MDQQRSVEARRRIELRLQAHETRAPDHGPRDEVKIKWKWRGSNPRPLRCERSALPTELHPRDWQDAGIEPTSSAFAGQHRCADLQSALPLSYFLPRSCRCGDGGTRTRGLLLAKQALSPSELHPQVVDRSGVRLRLIAGAPAPAMISLPDWITSLPPHGGYCLSRTGGLSGFNRALSN